MKEHYGNRGSDQAILLEKFSVSNSKLTSNLQNIVYKFQRTIQRKFDLKKLPNKLLNWHSLTYKEFIAELGKKKIKLTLAEEADWEGYFIEEFEKAQENLTFISQTDQKIDHLVYQLYELTLDEIKVIEKRK